MTNPSHIGQYRIVRKLGAGGMGMVFLGEHMLLGRRAAIKTLLPTVAINQEIVERFFNEARAASAISDAGVIQIFDFGYHVDGTAYIVMELLEGEALSARIDRLGKLPLPDALRIARQIAGSLASAHACNVVHRDLKPDNIFLVRDVEAQGGERTKILDFGICKVGASEGEVAVTQAGAMVGTPVYMSPEQCRGIEVDHRSDIYAFGCLLFHMLTGRPPFIGEASGDLIVAHMQADPPAPSLYVGGLPFEIDALVLRCLEKAPEDRFPSMNELHLVLGDIYAQIDTSESTVAVVTPAMQLGEGFRSVYDANLSRFAAGASRISPTHRLRPPLPYVATPPGTPPKLPWTKSAPNDTDDDDLAGLLQPRHTAVRVLLAGLAVAAVVIALVVIPDLQAGGDQSALAGTAPVAAATGNIPELSESPPPEAAALAAAALAAGIPEPAPAGVEATSHLDRTVERTSILEVEAQALGSAEITAAEVKPPAETKSPAAPRSPETKSSPESKPSATKGPVVTPAEAARTETKAPPATKGPVTSPTEVASPSSKPANGKPTETRSAAETKLAVDRKPASEPDSQAHVTTLTKQPAAPAQTSQPTSPPPATPPPAPPPRPSPSNEDLYDTR